MFNINNHAQFIGTVDREPGAAGAMDGVPVTEMILACQDNFLKRDGSPSVQHIPVIIQNPDSMPDGVTTGALVAINASLINQSWTGSDGGDHASMKILADEIHVLKPANQKGEPTS